MGVVSSEQERLRVARPGAQRRICLPSPAPTRATMLAEFVKWADGNPSNKVDPAAASLLKFKSERYPCRTGASSNSS